MIFNRYTWREARKKGIVKFIIKYGIVHWGLPASALYHFIFPLFNHSIVFHSIVQLILSFVGYTLITGILIGLFFWFYNEHKYKKYD